MATAASGMSVKKGDPRIGTRAFYAVLSKFGSIKNASEHLGVTRYMLYSLRKGVTPSGYALQAMALAGLDVHYILTGFKNTKNGGEANE